MNEENVVQIGLALDTSELKQGIVEAETQLEQLQGVVARVSGASAIGGSTEIPTVVQPPSAGAPPPPSPPKPPDTGSSPASPLESAWEEFAKIKSMASSSPDVARAALEGQGGLQGRVSRSAVAAGLDDPDTARQYQDLLVALKDLNKSITDGTRDEGGNGPAQILGFLRNNALINTVGQVGSQLAGGNIVGAGATGAGAGLGMLLGGPLGAQAGAQLGSMAGGAINSFLSGASESQQYSIMSGDIAARFGNFSEAQDLSVDGLQGMKTSGYSFEETANTFDTLRQLNVIDEVDTESKALVESLQELSRATGENTQALVQNYANYKTLGGEQDAQGYMSQMLAGAVAAGMKENMGQYQEMVGSARMQLVAGNGMGDYGDEGLKGIQGILGTYLGQENRTSSLLQDNPMMAQQMLSSLLRTGATQSGMGADASMMMMQGIDASKTTEGYISAGQQTDNAVTRQRFIAEQFLNQSTGAMGLGDRSQFFAAAEANPNYVQDLLTNNPDGEQAKTLQNSLDVMIATSLSKPIDAVTAQDRQIAMQSVQAYGASGGELTAQTITGDGKTLDALITESQKSEGQMAREAAAERHKEMMRIMESFAPLLTSIDQATTSMLRYVEPLAEAISSSLGLKPTETFTATGASAPIAISQSQAENSKTASGLREEAKRAIAGNREFQQGRASVGEAVRGAATSGALNMIPGMNVGRAVMDGVGALFGGNDAPADAEFNDTPETGVLATSGFNTFRFRPGDTVYAQQSGGGSSSGGMDSPNITVNITPPGNADTEWMRGAARAGTAAGLDEFTSSWRGRQRGAGARGMNTSSY